MPSIDRDSIRSDIVQRWGILDWKGRFPWWRKPAKVRILMYADSSVHFEGGPFLGLQYVKTLLESRAYFYVDFDIATAHRDGTDPSASISGAMKLTDLDIINKYEQVWFFGINETPNLTPAEVTLLDQFMAAPKFGGVLVTGDHANLGQGIAGQITRAGQMRRYPAPGLTPGKWNTTLEEGPDPGTSFDFEDQSDDRPQNVRYERFSIWSGQIFRRRYRPHPVMCGPTGPITVFPDHQHEGEALAPVPGAGDPKWPTKGGYQERPRVIGWGKIKDPAAERHGQEIGLASAYDGQNVDVGRIVADSTWHHWFDINLTGIAANPPYAGFDATPAGRAALTQIDAYFLNCGVWLAPPDQQVAMRHAAWWSILWTDRIVELSIDSPIWLLGEQAINALGLRAPRCTVSEWIFDFPIFKEKIPRWEWPQLFEKFDLVSLPFEHFVAGGILRRLVRDVGPSSSERQFPREAPPDEVLFRAINAGIEEGLDALKEQLTQETVRVTELIRNDFRLSSSPNDRSPNIDKV
ncbi:hypothetical protein [Cupriavidus sp. AcVe19-6a]|uniref:hypothetical protein n=1 Tax=Cupriavidus sp. AcVe19-6a TaxID=2821358 RepID=UPI001AEAB471|nr:hypothetical protein [Cupriavidus sp. AcVe19-6a]MBP0639449.1 hypothetical protein [Cupriavidus sp. AcVe19-6a]